METQEQIILTEQHIADGASMFGAWSRTQLALIGVQWPPKQGWKSRIIGRYINKSDVERFLALKNAHQQRTKGDRKKERLEYANIINRKKADNDLLV